jgi:FkbM family methyltransferase
VSTPTETIFDQKHYLELIEARGETIRKIVPQLANILELSTALDAGCGLGFFSQVLSEYNLKVTGVDGRSGNIDEAHRRYPELTFGTQDIEDSSIVGMGSFDLVLCFGLLYHLENPLRAIRHLRGLTGKVLLLESMCLPSMEPFALLREEQPLDDQSLTNLAFYPSEGCIVKMLYACGFTSVYRVEPLPKHDEFRETPEHSRVRTVIAAAFTDLNVNGLVRLREPREEKYPWAKQSLNVHGQVSPAQKLWKGLRRRLAPIIFNRLLGVGLPIRLRFGGIWIPRTDHIGVPVGKGTFETAEINFVSRFLRTGMTMLDVGAHHGLYSLLASRKVGPKGRVISFEPSPRERNALRLNLALNWCTNVSVQGLAVGNEQGEATFYLVEGTETGCNSLRPPALQVGSYRPIKVHTTRLDDWLRQRGIQTVDFIKLDVEGAELSVLQGAVELLAKAPRPVLLIEVAEIRTAAWRYSAREILSFMERLGYVWFCISSEGNLTEMRADVDLHDANLVAVPKERREMVEVC